jgi:segregation and condensation protein B
MPVQKLLEKELIIISGRNEKLPGHPLVYSTSRHFMDYFGINSAEDLPKNKRSVGRTNRSSYVINDATPTEEEPKEENPPVEVLLSVTEDGELVDKTESNSSDEVFIKKIGNLIPS